MSEYRGTVFPGLGVAQHRVLDNMDLYAQKSGMVFFPGTLNVRIENGPIKFVRSIFIPANEIKTPGRRSNISLVPAKLWEEDVFIFFPENPMYDIGVLEILSAVKLREKYNLHDGDQVAIVIE